MPETVLTHARIVLEDEVLDGSLVIRDGLIAEVLPGRLTRGEDLGGDFLLPGLVELHTDHLEGHFTPRPGTHWDGLPAVLAHDVQMSGAGVSTVLDAVRIGFMGHTDDAAASAHAMVEAITHAGAAGLTRAEHLIHLRCEVAAAAAADQFSTFADTAGVALVSLMDHTPGQRQYADPEAFRRYMVGKGLIPEADLERRMAALAAEADEHAESNRTRVAALARERGLTLAAHDDASVEHVEAAVALGVHISEFPTTETAAAAARHHGQAVVMGAPNLVRGASQSGNVAARHLLELGLLDILSSDYVPASPLQAIFALAAEDALSLPRGVQLVATAPAAAVGLEDRGAILAGRRADLVRVEAHAVAPTPRHPRGQCVPVVRSLLRAGVRVL